MPDPITTDKAPRPDVEMAQRHAEQLLDHAIVFHLYEDKQQAEQVLILCAYALELEKRLAAYENAKASEVKNGNR